MYTYLFYREAAIVNAYIDYCARAKVNSLKTPKTHFQFRTELVAKWAALGSGESASARPRATNEDAVPGMVNILGVSNKPTRVWIERGPQTPGHLPYKIKGEPKGCVVCMHELQERGRGTQMKGHTHKYM